MADEMESSPILGSQAHEGDVEASNTMDRVEMARPTVQLLNPSYLDPGRQADVGSATFNLVSTIMGGGSLSLAYAFSQTGLVWGVISLLVWAVLGDFSIWLLVRAGRGSGASTFEDVALLAFGRWMKVAVVVQVFLLTWLVMSGYTILAGTMAVDVYKFVSGTPDLPESSRTIAMICVALYTFPRCIAEKLDSLKWTSMFSVMSMIALCGLICFRTAQRYMNPNFVASPIRMWPDNWEILPYTAPLFAACYMCHFNVLPMHRELAKPTRGRMRSVLRFTILCCTVVYIFLGLVGYLWDRENTCDNILLNFCETDWVVTGGRTAIFLVITFNLPLVCIPCRNSFDRLVAFRQLLSDKTEEPEPVGFWRRAFVTIFLIGGSTTVAVVVPAVKVIWTFIGSTMTMSIAFMMPSAFYLKLRTDKPWNTRKILAAGLLAFSTACMFLCTYEAIKNMGEASSCPAGYDACAAVPH